jgi:hypothetical protein
MATIQSPALVLLQAMRMIALLASAAGKTTVKSPAELDLSEPKSRITQALLVALEL